MAARRTPPRPADPTLENHEEPWEDAPARQRFSNRFGRVAQQRRIERTVLLRAAEAAAEHSAAVGELPVGQVRQVHSLFLDVAGPDGLRRCVIRKTLLKILDTPIVVGDRVRFRDTGTTAEDGRPEAVIEQLLPRTTLLTRADSFKGLRQDPMVANAGQMLIVVSLAEPAPRWGLVDRMVVAARAGGLKPTICLNKVDLAATVPAEAARADEVLTHYQRLGLTCLRASVVQGQGLAELRAALTGQFTALAGHSGVGKSSLIAAIQPGLDIRIGAISGYTGKGRHTTSSARIYDLDLPAQVVDTPGVKLFGLWNVHPDNLLDYFPDVAEGWAPAWREESCRRIAQSLEGQSVTTGDGAEGDLPGRGKGGPVGVTRAAPRGSRGR